MVGWLVEVRPANDSWLWHKSLEGWRSDLLLFLAVRFDDEYCHFEVNPGKLDNLPDDASSQKECKFSWYWCIAALCILFDMSHSFSFIWWGVRCMNVTSNESTLQHQTPVVSWSQVYECYLCGSTLQHQTPVVSTQGLVSSLA